MQNVTQTYSNSTVLWYLCMGVGLHFKLRYHIARTPYQFHPHIKSKIQFGNRFGRMPILLAFHHFLHSQKQAISHCEGQ